MKNLHTPGPWKPSFNGPICIGVQNGDFYGQMICNSILPESDELYEKEKGEIEANMQLIASAPELLEAANEAYDAIMFLESKGVISKLKTGNRAILSMLGEAIRKARGL